MDQPTEGQPTATPSVTPTAYRVPFEDLKRNSDICTLLNSFALVINRQN